MTSAAAFPLPGAHTTLWTFRGRVEAFRPPVRRLTSVLRFCSPASPDGPRSPQLASSLEREWWEQSPSEFCFVGFLWGRRSYPSKFPACGVIRFSQGAPAVRFTSRGTLGSAPMWSWASWGDAGRVFRATAMTAYPVHVRTRGSSGSGGCRPRAGMSPRCPAAKRGAAGKCRTSHGSRGVCFPDSGENGEKS